MQTSTNTKRDKGQGVKTCDVKLRFMALGIGQVKILYPVRADAGPDPLSRSGHTHTYIHSTHISHHCKR